jgi:hypothetical protein
MVTTLGRMALVLGAAALAACSSPLDADPQPEGVRFTVDRDAYAPGDTVSARLVNGSEVALGYNLCLASLERQDGAGWTVVDEPLWICTSDLKRLPAGESVPYRRALSAGLERGRYRLRTHVEHPLPGGSRAEVHSRIFSVAR